MKPLLLTLFLFPVAITGCGKEDVLKQALDNINSSGGGAGPAITLSGTPPQGRQDVIYSFALTGSESGLTYSILDGPSWLSIDQDTGTLSGVPLEPGSVAVQVKAQASARSVSKTFTIEVAGDPLKSQQWSLENNGQSSFSASGGVAGEDLRLKNTIKNGIHGDGVRIAVSDSGIQLTHEDLSENLLSGEHRDYTLNSPPYLGDPTPDLTIRSNHHGTSVAGIIGASGWNSKGVRGVAPKSRVAGFKFIGISASSDPIKLYDQTYGNFDIFNYSYGPPQFAYIPADPYIFQKYKYSVENLRNGKGAIFIQSAGNDFASDYADTPYSQLSGLYYLGNSNLSGEQNTPYVISVGAFNSQGSRSSYSSPGANLWVSAPGGEYGLGPSISGPQGAGILSPDFMGCSNGSSYSSAYKNDFEKGFLPENPNCNYTSTMNGTSSAAPNTSGAVALMLQANQNLTWRDVKHILATTARKIDPYAGPTANPLGYVLSGHVYQEGWITNSAGYHFHNWYGFGAVNVDSAVNMAQSYSTTLGQFRSSDDDDSTWQNSSGSINLPIPDGSSTGVSSQINLYQNLTVEGVQIKVSLPHPWLGDIGIELTSPSGTTSKILNVNSDIYDSNLNNAIFLTNAFYGESSNGAWTLKVIDGYSGAIGTLSDWAIRVYGHNPINPPDTTPPNPVLSVTHVSVSNSQTESPLISWPQSSSGDVLRYEYSIGTASGSNNIKDWTSAKAALSATATGLSLSAGVTYFANIRVIDTWENISQITSSSGWTFTTLPPPGVTIGAPSQSLVNSAGSVSFPVTFSGAANVTLSPSNIILQASGSASCTSNVSGIGSSQRNITFSSCSGNGSVQFSIATNAAQNSAGLGSLQSSVSSTFSVDNTPPSVTGLSNDSTITRIKTWTWGCSEQNCNYRYVIDSSPITPPGGFFSASTSATLNTGSGIYYLHVQAVDSAGNESTPIHVSAVLDNTPPNITGLADDAVWKKTKTWAWGCDKASCTYRTLVDTNPTSSPVSAYSSVTTVTQTTGTGTYYLHIQALDSVGNVSPIQHYSVLLDNNPPSVPAISLSAAASNSLSETPPITLSGGNDAHSGFQKFQIRIKRALVSLGYPYKQTRAILSKHRR